jgi:hypothetical protein
MSTVTQDDPGFHIFEDFDLRLKLYKYELAGRITYYRSSELSEFYYF